MLKLHKLLTLFLVLLAAQSFAQNETKNWYFGNKAGIVFDQSPPSALPNSNMNTGEGCSTISDSLGNLLFYTDGVKVWNRMHNQMPNGYGLMGNFDASQSALIIKKPGSNNIYYIFTTSARVEQPGFRYSVVDMSLNGGLGNVSQKNIPLLSPSTEKITAVNHRNDQDVWVLAHGWNNNSFYAYPVTSSGVGTPVISNVGSIHSGAIENSQGCMKLSPDGTRLALAIENLSTIEVFKFDDRTGQVSDPESFTDIAYRWAYGIEFSHDASYLFFTRMGVPGAIYSIHMETDGPLRPGLFQQSNADLIGALQLGMDGNIFMALPNSNRIGRITQPYVVGGGFGFNQSNINVGTTANSNYGLPAFNQNYFLKPSFKHKNICIGDITEFNLRVQHKFSNVTWNFGDSASGPDNTAAGYSPSHQFTAPGLYTITVSGQLNNGETRTGVYRLNIVNLPEVNLGPDTTFCMNDTITLKADKVFARYYWSTGDSVPELRVTDPGTYVLTVVSTEGCINSDTIEVSQQRPSMLFSTRTRQTCFGESVALEVDNKYATNIIWPDSSTGPVFVAEKGGIYRVSYDFNGCTYQDSVEVVYKNCPDKFKVPNVFTPNNDQHNDIFVIQGLAPGHAALTIYNRWGKEVFRADNYMQDWDGTNQSPGTYYYILTIPETNEVYKGWVELIR